MCWMTAMSVLLWIKFRAIRAPTAVRTVSHGALGGFKDKRFKWYGLVAWGIPVAMTLVTTLMQLLPEEATCGLVVPGIGSKRGCFLDSKGYAQLVYLYVILLPVIAANFAMFCGFTYNLLWGLWAPDKIQMQSSGSLMQRKQYTTVVKMFFVLGVTWSFEIIAYVLGHVYKECNEGANVIISIFRVITTLQGVWMFLVISVDHKRVGRSLHTAVRKLTSTGTEVMEMESKMSDTAARQQRRQSSGSGK